MKADNIPEIFKNERVSASAGSGKTHALTSRFIALAARETDPETGLPDPSRITALTFTRKSAGEFLEKILTRLAEAAESDSAAEELSGEIERLTVGKKSGGRLFTRDHAALLLRQCVRNLDKIRLCTIDSFFASLLKSFPNELSIFSEIRIIDGIARRNAEEKTVDEILRDESVDEKTFSEFSETIKRASFGADGKSVRRTLYENIADSRAKLMETPDTDSWGNIEAIIPKSSLLKWDPDAYARETDELAGVLKAEGLSDAFASTLAFFAESNGYNAEKPTALLSRLAEIYAAGRMDGPFKIAAGRRECEISERAAQLLKSLLTRLLCAHVVRACEAAKAAGKIAAMFEKKYTENVVRSGRLTFEDVPVLLASESRPVEGLMEYRLDAKFNHWLFDEFQDTSKQQWSFFKNIVDNIVDAPGGEKTFFYVGDPKQSLYSWRGGDRRLFDSVKRYYNRGQERIFDGEKLTTSWRSGANVIEIVNSFFKSESDLARAFEPAAAAEFSSMFSPHISAESAGAKPSRPSLAQLRLTKRSPKDSDGEFDAVCGEIFKIIKEADPAARGITCAILVNDNATVKAVVKNLRARISEEKLKIEVAGELEKTAARDNMVVPAFLQILQLAAHPSDTAAEQYLKMTPFADIATESGFRKKILEKTASGGAKAAADEFANLVESKIELSEAGRENLARLVETCREFDESDMSGIDACAQFIRLKKFRLSSTDNSIQVMTIHKSKGLGFGMVILPDLHKIAMRTDRGLKYVVKDDPASGQKRRLTVAYFPPKIICSLSPILSESVKMENENESFENICKLYVALTRAERAVYVVMPELSKFEPAKSFGIKNLILNSFIPVLRGEIPDSEKKEAYLQALSSGGVSDGDTTWYENAKYPEENAETAPIFPVVTLAQPPFFEHLTPSNPQERRTTNLNPKNAEFGNAVHAAFERIIFAEESAAQTAAKAAAAAGIPERLRKSAAAAVAEVLSNPEIAPLFKKDTGAKVFNEFSFDALIDGKFARGSIDRLMLKCAEGRPGKATIIDFKPRAAHSEAAARQLGIYKRAVAKIFGIPEGNIAVKTIYYLDAKISDFTNQTA